MSAPGSFTLDPVSPENRPTPVPPRHLKHQIYKDPSVFKPVDDHAVNEARTNYRSFKDLMYHLLFKKQFNQLEKARVIFRWMTTKNMYTIMFDSELPGSPEQVISGFKDGKTTYARIFECLCSFAGLHCVTISGWAKGVDYRPGAPITSTPVNHSWNAVYIDGNWQLVDSHWATRYLQSERNTPENLVYEYDDFYFMPEPSHLIYSHCPEDPIWELVHPARSRSEYEEYPLVKSFFFSVGMEFLLQNRGVVYTKNGLFTLTLGFTRPTAFTFRLGYGEKMQESLQGIQLKRYIIQETTENRVTFYFRAPREGNYYMTVFAQPVGERIRVENVFKAACEYKIVCHSAAGDNHPYPQTSDANWGPGAPVKQYGLTPSHNTAIVDAPNGKAEVSFTKTRPVRVYARLAKDGMDEDTLERSVTVREQDNQIFVTAHLPTRGEYGLEIYANEPDREGDTFTHMCQYLCAYIERDFGTQYGQVYDRSDLTSSMQAAPVGYGMAPTEYAGKPGDMARTKPPGKQVYSTSSQDWDGNTFTQKTFREETETADDGVKSYRQQSQGSELKKPGPPVMDKVTSRMETVTIGGKKAPPPTAPKPPGYPGYDQEDFPPPPPELMDQTYNQQRKGAVHDDLPPPPPEATAGQGPDGTYKLPPSEVPKKPPVEIVYVPIGKSPKSERKEQDEAKKGKPIEVVYVGGSKGSPSMFRKGGAGDGTSPQGSPGSARRAQDLSAQEKHHREAADRKPEHGGKLEDVPAYQSRGPGGEQLPPPPPPGGDQGTHYIPVQVQDQSKRPYGEQPTAQRETTVPVYHEKYPFGAGGSGQAPMAYESQLHTEPEHEYKPHAAKVYSSSITIAPPSNFEPQPITREEAAPKPAPPEVPPKPFKDTKIFQNVDTHAVEVSKEEHKSFRDLVWHLIYARNITNELEKARAIFLWLCSKDLTKLNFENIPKGSPEEILMSLKQGQTTYAVVYETLCSYAELHCKTVSGYAKGAEYKPGMKFTGEQGQHSWNAVLVNGAWRLVDCHWAARRLVGKKVTADNVRYELDEYYFMPDPHQLIFTHFPDDINWQLVERRITLTDFENLVPVKSAFFKYGLQILSHREAVIRTEREVTVRVGSPPLMSQNLAFTFTLSYDDGREEFQGIKLNRFGMQEFVDNVSFFTIRPPEKGSYRLIIYAKDLTQQTKEGVYGGVCEYEVICERSPAQPQPFPPCVHTSWGPGDSVAKYSLTPMQKGAIFSTVNGLAEVRFRLPKELRFTAKLKSNDKDEKALGGYIMHRVVGDLAIFTINPPYKGEFGLEIYANDSEVDGNSLYHAYQYLIICTDIKGPVEALPALPPGYLGPQPTFKKLGLSADTHADPYIQTDNGDLQVSFSTDKPLRLTSQLIYVTGGKNEEFSDYVLQQGRGNAVTFMVKLPKTGLYKFQIYALPYTDSSESLPGVYNYLINCHNTFATLIPFPKQYGQWKEGCYLFEPVEGTLQANRPSKGSASSYQYIYFKLDVSKAKAVAVVVGEDWTQLEQKPSGTWEGEVFMEKHWGQESKAALCANYGSVKASYSTLLEYTM